MKRVCKSIKGQAVVEYALLALLVGATVTLTTPSMGGALNSVFGRLNASIAGVGPPYPPKDNIDVPGEVIEGSGTGNDNVGGEPVPWASQHK